MKTKIQIIYPVAFIPLVIFFVLSTDILYGFDSDSTHIRKGIWGGGKEYQFRNVPEDVGYLTSLPMEKIRQEIGDDNFNKMNIEVWIHTSVNNAEVAMVEHLNLSNLFMYNIINTPLLQGTIGDNCWHQLNVGAIRFLRNNILVQISPNIDSLANIDYSKVEWSARKIDSIIIESDKVQDAKLIPAPEIQSLEVTSDLPENIDDLVRIKIEATDPNNQEVYFRQYASGFALVWGNEDTRTLFSNNITEDSTGVKIMIWAWNEDHIVASFEYHIPFLVTFLAYFKNRADFGNPDFLFLQQNCPNPFSEKTTINCFIPITARSAFLKIFSIDGTLVKTSLIAGRNQTSLAITGLELDAGMYFYSLIIDNKVIDSKRMILEK